MVTHLSNRPAAPAAPQKHRMHLIHLCQTVHGLEAAAPTDPAAPTTPQKHRMHLIPLCQTVHSLEAAVPTAPATPAAPTTPAALRVSRPVHDQQEKVACLIHVPELQKKSPFAKHIGKKKVLLQIYFEKKVNLHPNSLGT